jgi:hypothetical protein
VKDEHVKDEHVKNEHMKDEHVVMMLSVATVSLSFFWPISTLGFLDWKVAQMWLDVTATVH